MRALLRTATGIALLAAAGCSGGTADVVGKVTFQGKPVVYGTVMMIGPDGIPKSGEIQPDGTYRVRGLRTGTAQVTVSSPRPPGPAPAGKKAREGRDADDEERRAAVPVTPVSPEVAKGWFPIPDKYADPERSGLKIEAKRGQPVDLELK